MLCRFPSVPYSKTGSSATTSKPRPFAVVRSPASCACMRLLFTSEAGPPILAYPNYGLEEAPYIESARAAYGRKGATDVEQLLTQTRALFAGGDVPEQDKELFFQAVTEAYFANKQRASEKFTRKDYKK